MNTPNKLIYLLLLAVLPSLYSCEESPEPIIEEEARYSNGALVVNQGNFGSADGSLDFFYFENDQLVPFVYQKENDEAINSIIEDVAFHNDRMYIVANRADQIIVTDADSLNTIASITAEDLLTPRYFTASGDKGYVSVWGPYEADYSLKNSTVAVLDLNSNSILSYIPVPAGPEGIVAIGNKVFVANSSTDTITVINSGTEAVVEKIKTYVAPKHFVVDEANKLWVVYGSGNIARINPETYEEELLIELSGDTPSGKIQLVNNTLYYHTSRYSEDYSKTFNAVYALDLSSASPAPVQILEKENLKTFAVQPETGNIFGGIAVGADAGTVVVFDQEGNELYNFAAGKFPHEIIFR